MSILSANRSMIILFIISKSIESALEFSWGENIRIADFPNLTALIQFLSKNILTQVISNKVIAV